MLCVHPNYMEGIMGSISDDARLGNMGNSVIYENIDSGHPCFIMLMGTANVV